MFALLGLAAVLSAPVCDICNGGLLQSNTTAGNGSDAGPPHHRPTSSAATRHPLPPVHHPGLTLSSPLSLSPRRQTTTCRIPVRAKRRTTPYGTHGPEMRGSRTAPCPRPPWLGLGCPYPSPSPSPNPSPSPIALALALTLTLTLTLTPRPDPDPHSNPNPDPNPDPNPVLTLTLTLTLNLTLSLTPC